MPGAGVEREVEGWWWVGVWVWEREGLAAWIAVVVGPAGGEEEEEGEEDFVVVEVVAMEREAEVVGGDLGRGDCH